MQTRADEQARERPASKMRPRSSAAWPYVLFALLTSVYPVARAFRLEELNYNEGWNVYNAMTVAAGGQLYPAKYAWTSVNYPMGSFALVAGLHHVTHDYLFTGRALSIVGLLLCCVAMAGIAHVLGATRRAVLFTFSFTMALFCLENVGYIGINDPQMLAQGIFMLGLLVYVAGRARRFAPAWIAAAALLFAVGGSIKQSPIDVPIAVFVDLLFASVPMAAWFAACGAVFGGGAVWLNLHFGGPWFVRDLLAGREYSILKAMALIVGVFGPVLPALVLGAGMALALRRDPKRRIASVLLATSLTIGCYFLGGSGVAQNAAFTALLAIVLLVGLAISDVERGSGVSPTWTWLTSAHAHRAAIAVRNRLPLLVFALLIFPALVFQSWNPVAKLREAKSAEPRFAAEVNFLRAQPGPAICESLLQCAYAGKPYLYDPFNATRFEKLGKLDGETVVRQLEHHGYGAVQMDHPPPGIYVTPDRFTPEIMNAVVRNYTIAMQKQDTVILVPKAGQ